MTTPQIKPVTPFTIGNSAEASAGTTPGAEDPNAASPPGAPPPELVEAEQARTTAEMELDSAKNEASQKDKLQRDQVTLSTAIRPVQRQTEHQLSKVTELRDRIKGDGPKPRGRVFALNKIASLLEKSAIGGAGGAWTSTNNYTASRPYKPKTPDPSFEESFEPTMYNNREMALDEADSIYGDQTTPITSGYDWAQKGIQARQQQNAQRKQQMGYSPDSSNLRDAWNNYVANPWQYAAGNVADFGQNVWAGAGKNLGANHMAAKAGLREMQDQVIRGAAASPRSWPGKIVDGLGSLRTDSIGNYIGDTSRTVANLVPFLGPGMYQDPRQREREAAAEAAAVKAEAAAASRVAPAVPSDTPTNFGDLTQALLPFLGMNNQFGGYDGYGGQRPDHSGNFVELMRVLGNMQREKP